MLTRGGSVIKLYSVNVVSCNPEFAVAGGHSMRRTMDYNVRTSPKRSCETLCLMVFANLDPFSRFEGGGRDIFSGRRDLILLYPNLHLVRMVDLMFRRLERLPTVSQHLNKDGFPAS